MKKNCAVSLMVFLICIQAFSEEALDKIAVRAVESKSDAIVVSKKGEQVFRFLPAGSHPIETMSMTKSLASLAIGFLIDEKKIKSVHEPLTRWFPEWKGSPKQEITLEHVLTQTSGLKASVETSDIYQQKDFVQYALDAELQTKPGTVFFYNNRAINLIAGIVKRASGQTIDQYLNKKLFAPLKITDFIWKKDPVGNPECMSGLQLSADDLVKIGELLIAGGKWRGKQLISQKWISQSTEPSRLNENYGYLWWLTYDTWVTKVTDDELAAYRAASLTTAFVNAVAKSQMEKDFRFNDLRQERPDLKNDFLRFDQLFKEGKIPYPHQIPMGVPTGFVARGSIGQQLVILPAKRNFGIRQKIKHGDSDEQDQGLRFDDFAQLLMAL